MSKLFKINMTWVKTIILAVICGVATGVVMQIPILENTSFHNIGVTMEFWIFMGMLVSVNCKKWWEAGLKTFIFFLISQPLVYLVMWPVYHSFPWHYYLYWLYWTFACLPLGCLAWYIKKGNILSVVILLAVCALLCFHGVEFLGKTFINGQHQLLAAAFCFAQVVFYIAVLLNTSKKKFIVGVVCVLMTFALGVFTLALGPNSTASMPLDNANEYSITVEDEHIVVLEGVTDSAFTLKATGYGSTQVTFTAANGTQLCYDVTVSRETRSMDIVPHGEQ